MNHQIKPDEEERINQDEKIGKWLCLISSLAWLFGAASFGVTGGSPLVVLVANLGFVFGPFAFLFGAYLLAKCQALRRSKQTPTQDRLTSNSSIDGSDDG